MSFAVVERAPVTAELVTVLSTLGFPVGDNNAPKTPYGWQGEADASGSDFMPWITVMPMPGSGMGAPHLDSLVQVPIWELGYSVFVAGVDRSQTEKLADRVRNALANLVNVAVTGEAATWELAGVRCVNLGSNNRVGEAIPYYFTQTDSFVVRVLEG